MTPDSPEVQNKLGIALREGGYLDEAIAACRRALELRPRFPEAQVNLGAALAAQGRLDQAISAYRSAVEEKPGLPEAHNNLGNALRERGNFDEAVAACRRALDLKPNFPEAHNNLGAALAGQRRLEEAVAAYRRALELQPGFPAAHNNLGAALSDRGRLDEAVAAYRRALELQPGFPAAHNNLGSALKDRGELDEAIAELRRAVHFRPDFSEAHSNLIYTLQFHPGHNARSLAKERQRWNWRFSNSVRRFVTPHANESSAERRLRVGYVSPDLRSHVVGRNVMPLFEFHNPRHVEIICYAGVVHPDEFTDEFHQRARQWRSTVGLGDEALAEMIRQDGVDILVDLSQHQAGNRLPMFARKPAPVQVSFAGYPESTGLEAIEYRISDRYLESGPKDEETGSTEMVHLIDSFWCYDPCGIEVEVNGLPATDSGNITFGCLNNFCKVNEQALSLWAQVLGKVTDSRLILLTSVGSHRQRAREFLEKKGIESHRVDFVEFRPRREYLKLYHRLDIILDTFPYNGHTTSLDALWMGVPVVSLAGETPVSRAGLSQLSNLGLPEWVAHSESEYVKIAEKLAGDLPRLAQLRSTLRERMENSVLMDAPRFARQVEEAYRKMWKRWCAASG
jgi:predicted O-linked N-acetylglucosamine transferase (SPINDLY family)